MNTSNIRTEVWVTLTSSASLYRDPRTKRFEGYKATATPLHKRSRAPCVLVYACSDWWSPEAEKFSELRAGSELFIDGTFEPSTGIGSNPRLRATTFTV